jgi:translation initiation factor 5
LRSHFSTYFVISLLASLELQDAKKKKKAKDDSDSDKDKKAKKDKKKKDKKKEKGDHDDGKDYIKKTLEGRKSAEDAAFVSNDEDSVASETGVDDEGALMLAVEATKKFLEDNPKFSNAALVEYVANQQMASSLKSHEKVQILIRSAITSNFFKNKEIKKFAPVVIGITNGNKIMERFLISSLEAICVDKPKNFPVMMKQFYDEDALDEETILDWSDEGRSEYTFSSVDEETRAELRGEAEPLVIWLQEADSEDDSSAAE